jgi:hypothetical protein
MMVNYMKNIMKKSSWIIGVVSFLLLVQSALAAATVNDYFYYNGLPVTNVFMQNYICLDAGCYTLGPLIQSANSGSSNLVTTIYPLPSPTYGYATYWYASCYQYMERYWIPSCSNNNCVYTYTEQFSKYQNCKADIININATSVACLGTQVNISASIKSALTEAPLAPWGEPSDPDFVRDFLSSKVNATLTITNSTGSVIFTDTKILYILRDYTNTTNFALWTPTAPGTYTATIQTKVPDCKCSNTIPDTEVIVYTIPECCNDNDCNKLDKDYCDGNLLKHDEGICVNQKCEVTTNTTNCDNGLYCDGEETCVNAICIPGTSIDCSGNNICSIATCDYNPDNIHYTWDFRNPFTSVCDECTDSCTTGNNTITHECSVANCGAECDPTHCCVNKCIGNTRYYSGSCTAECSCSYFTQNCDLQDGCYAYSTGCEDRNYFCDPSGCDYTFSNRNVDYNESSVQYCVDSQLKSHIQIHNYYCNGACSDHVSWSNDQLIDDCNSHDGWYNTTTTQWIPTCQCTEKEQIQKEQRDYSCDPSGCIYNITSTAWVDTGATRYKENGTPCNDGLWCTDGDACLQGTCTGGPRNCHETPDILCTLDSCDEVLDQCIHTPDNSYCNDGLYCNGQEFCNVTSGCQSGTPINCSGNNICSIATCDYNPDNIHYTWDFRNPFTSSCVNDGNNQGHCTIGDTTITHECSVANCGAQCDAQNPCQNKCVNSIRYYNGICQENCSCQYQIENCNSLDNWYNTTTTQWVSAGQCTEKEQLLQQYRDYSCSPSGCTFSVITTQWIDTGNTENKEDGTICDDGIVCTTNDVCTNGICSGTINDTAWPQVLYVFSGKDWVGLGDTFYVDSKIIDDSAECMVPKCLVKIIDNQNKEGYLQGSLTYDISIQKCRGYVTVNDTFHESSAKLVVEVWDAVGHYNSSYTIIGIDNSKMVEISGVNESKWYKGGDWLNGVTATVEGTFGILKECSVDINGINPEHTLIPSGNTCSGNIRIPSNLTDGNKKLTITAININNNLINDTVNIQIDNSPPTKNIISPTNDTSYGSLIPIIVNASDAYSGVKNGTYRIVQDPWRLFGLIPIPGTDYDSGWISLVFNGATWTDNFDTAPLSSGRTYYLAVNVCDNAGNCDSVEA